MWLFRMFVPRGTLVLLLVEIILVSMSLISAVYLFYVPSPTIYLFYEGGFGPLLLMVTVIIAGMYFQDLYSFARNQSHLMLAQSLCMAIGSAFLVQGLVSYLHVAWRLPIRVLVPGAMLSTVLIFVWRLVFAAAIWKVGRRRLLFVGGSKLLDQIAAHLHAVPDIGMEVIGYLDDRFPENPHPHAKVLGPVSSLDEVARATCPDRIVVGMRERRNSVPVSALLNLRFAGFVIEEDTSFFETVSGRVSLAHFRPAQLIYSGDVNSRHTWLRSCIDFGVALVGALLTLPLMALIALAIKCSSPGPVLYRQTRVGYNGRVFTLYKFRSMHVDAEKHTGAVWSQANDPRVTSIGRILRNLRLDELPQMFNVLRLEMAIVGPRPERPEFVKVLAEQIPYYVQRHSVRPGITGWAQINYKYGETIEDAVRKLEYDLYYIKHRSQSLDNYIVFATLKVMLLSRGAR